MGSSTRLPWVALWVLASLAGCSRGCFVRLEGPLKEPPFSQAEEEQMFQSFLRNLNVNGTGAVIASPGEVPALVECCNMHGEQLYAFHWTRDAALSLDALIKSGRNESLGVTVSFVDRLRRQHARTQAAGNLDVSAAEEAFLEPKWTVDGVPYTGGWCRPQTDGPALRARTLLRAARALPSLSKDLRLLAYTDLDWLAKSPDLESCDIWEETRDHFLWNRAVTQAALLEGKAFAEDQGDRERSERFAAAAARMDPLTTHLVQSEGGSFLSNCPAADGVSACQRKGKTLDGAIVLTLVHGQVDGQTGPSNASALPAPTSALTARTAAKLAELFCDLYPVNQQDTAEGVPGVLLGRYKEDRYGANREGNPWNLITAAFAHLFYKAAEEAAKGPMSLEAGETWAELLGESGSCCGPESFLAAGDAVLLRLRHHVGSDLRLFEQIDRHTGQQYNAKDLTWSYAELLDALRSRRRAAAAAAPLV